jgi:stage V sporulation protein SpoVS
VTDSVSIRTTTPTATATQGSGVRLRHSERAAGSPFARDIRESVFDVTDVTAVDLVATSPSGRVWLADIAAAPAAAVVAVAAVAVALALALCYMKKDGIHIMWVPSFLFPSTSSLHFSNLLKIAQSPYLLEGA